MLGKGKGEKGKVSGGIIKTLKEVKVFGESQQAKPKGNQNCYLNNYNIELFSLHVNTIIVFFQKKIPFKKTGDFFPLKGSLLIVFHPSGWANNGSNLP